MENRAYKTILLRINNNLEWCNITSKEEFVKLLDNFGTDFFTEAVAEAGNKEYYVIYEKSVEAFWCIPKAEMELCLDDCDDYSCYLWYFKGFEKSLQNFLLHDDRANEEVFSIYKEIQKHINVSSEDSIPDKKVMLMMWFNESWCIWFHDILAEEYEYVNLTKIVWKSYKETWEIEL